MLLTDKAVPPGGEARVEVKIATANRAGTITKTVTVETDDPAKPTIQLTLKTTVIADMDLETNSLRFGDMELGSDATQSIPFLADDPAGLRFGEVRSSAADFRARMVKGEKDGKTRWSLEVTCRPVNVGHATAKIEVEMLAPEQKTMVVFVSARVKGEIRVTPDRVVLRKGTIAEDSPRTVRLQAEKGTFEVKSAKDPGGYFSVELETVTPGEVYLVHASLSGKGRSTDRFETGIVVVTTSKLQQKIVIPVEVFPIEKPGDQASAADVH